VACESLKDPITLAIEDFFSFEGYFPTFLAYLENNYVKFT